MEQNDKLYQRVLRNLQDNRDNVLAGNVNCIPSPLTRFRTDFVGIQKGMYFLVSAAQKCGKSKFTRFMFLYHPLIYAYNHPDQVSVKFFYFPLEESKEQIVTEFMAYLLYTFDKILICPTDLESTNETKVVSQEVLNLLKQDHYIKMLEYFNEHVEFCESRNPTGLWKTACEYFENNGTKISVDYIDNFGQQKQKFDRYIPNNPKEYTFFIWDHAGLTEGERGFDLRETIKKLSQYCVRIRDLYEGIPVVVQQQSTETQSLDAFKNNKIRPTKAGLSDCKDTGNDCSMMIGLSNPFAFELPQYQGYDITKLRDRARFLEIVLSRKGIQNGIAPLLFLGECAYITELPKANNTSELAKVYRYLNSINDTNSQERTSMAMFAYGIKYLLNKLK